MAKPVSKTLIGAFVLGAIALVFGGIVVLGSGALFRSTYDVVMFFDGSVGGLQVGAPVTFRGVAIGEVTGIQIVYEAERKEFLIPVAVRLISNRAERLSASATPMTLRELIDMGLRAQLQMQSFITGQLSILLDFFPDTPVQLAGGSRAGFGKRVEEIPTIPTPLQRIQKTIEQIPIDEVISDARETLASIRDILASPAIPEIIANLRQVSQDSVGIAQKVDAGLAGIGRQADLTLGQLRTLLSRVDAQMKPFGAAIEETRDLALALNRHIDPLAGEIKQTAEELRSTLRQSENTLAHIRTMTADNSELRFHLGLLMTELTATARSLRSLTDYLERHPDALWRGRVSDPRPGGQP
jgi:paraquat-inducible protein B